MDIAITTTQLLLLPKPRDTSHNTASCKNLNNSSHKKPDKPSPQMLSKNLFTPAKTPKYPKKISSMLTIKSIKMMMTKTNTDPPHALTSPESPTISTCTLSNTKPSGLK